MVRQYAPAHRARRRRRRAAGRLAVPGIAADLRARILSRKREPGAGLARLQDPCPVVRSQPGHAGRSAARAASWPRQLGGNSGKMNTLKCGRSSTTGPSPPVNSRYRPSRSRRSISPTVWPAVQVPGEHQRKQVGGPGEHSDRVVIGDLAQLTTSNLEHTGAADAGPARRGRWRTASRSALSPPGVAARADSDSQRPGKCDILVLLPDQAGLGRGSGRQGWTTPSSQRVGFRIPGPPRQPRTAASFSSR